MGTEEAKEDADLLRAAASQLLYWHERTRQYLERDGAFAGVGSSVFVDPAQPTWNGGSQFGGSG